jgi:hypothetical protein
MQWYGDLKRKDNKDYWLQRFMATTDFSENVIVDDVRYTNEAALIHALGGLLVRINWPTRTGKSTHPSETALDNFPIFDSVINKEHGLSLDNFIAICREHLYLWTGALDETGGNSDSVTGATVTTLSHAKRIPLQRYTKDT